ncbi:MAG: DNA polymerase domain-containing protein [Actinomycetota bacterium]
MAPKVTMVDAGGVEVRVTNPDKIFFPDSGLTKLDLVEYYLAVMPGVLAGCRDRPSTLYRWPNGVSAPDDAFFQKRVPVQGRPDWMQTVTVSFPSGRRAEMICLADAAHVAFAMNLGCIDLNPWPVRKGDVDHPDELRVDLDPTPDVPYEHVRETALAARDVLSEVSLVGWPKTSGKRGMHIYVRIEPRWTFTEVRRAALAFARAVNRKVPDISTTAWWKEERFGVFIDYNQNARDRTIASAYSVRPVPEARVSTPISWDEVSDVDPGAFTLETVPDRFRSIGDPGAEIDSHPGSLEDLLALADEDEGRGVEEAPLPPHFPKGANEPRRVSPSRRKKSL